MAEDSSHPSLVGQINEDLMKGIRRVPVDGEGPAGLPEPHERPDDKAQWDEVHGRWVEWDEQAQQWVPSPGQPPASVADAGTEPSEDHDEP
jgi:hypothetical protein